jgi:hypothetical protein
MRPEAVARTAERGVHLFPCDAHFRPRTDPHRRIVRNPTILQPGVHVCQTSSIAPRRTYALITLISLGCPTHASGSDNVSIIPHGNTFLALPDRGPNAVSYDSNTTTPLATSIASTRFPWTCSPTPPGRVCRLLYGSFLFVIPKLRLGSAFLFTLLLPKRNIAVMYVVHALRLAPALTLFVP